MSVGGKSVVAAPAAACVMFFAAGGALAEEAVAGGCPPGETSCAVGETIFYLPEFFAQYSPVSALDMVRRVPGFSIDPGDDVRGFGGAAGNVLIDGQRPSTKSADIFATLGRIAAASVLRIELIRGGAGNLDVGGQSVVVNVVRKSEAGKAEPSLWEFRLLKRRPNGGVRPFGEATFNGSAAGLDYTVGARAYGLSLRFYGDEDITRFAGPDERRLRAGALREQGGAANLKVEKKFGGGDIARFSFEISYLRLNEASTETRLLEVGGPDLALFTFPLEEFECELGADYEHAFTENFDVKLIAVSGRESENFESGFEFVPAAGAGERSVFLSDRTSGETIGRMEFDWKGWSGHGIQFGGEIARNFIDSRAGLLEEDASGALVPVPIDGATTRVSELRGEAFVSDSWKASPKLTVDLSFALELSRIRQSGDTANSRFFSYPKPSAKLTYAADEKTQWRLSATRTVSQLSFGQFVSSVNFSDEDVDFGNPDLRPQRAWEFAATYERRFGEIGVVELTGFYNLVQDVQDLLPLGGIVEVPGNIGDGTLYGGIIGLTAPLDRLMLRNARLESEFTWRTSSVTDPVDGRARNFSFTPNRFWEIAFRQDFPVRKVSWGFGMAKASEELGFGLDEVSVFENEMEFNAYIEATPIKGMKARFEANDIINVTSTRARTVFSGSRANGIALFEELQRDNNGGGLRLILSGTF